MALVQEAADLVTSREVLRHLHGVACFAAFVARDFPKEALFAVCIKQPAWDTPANRTLG